ncbi:hypothetical protein GCM10007304_11760 [Rhodococcoides trifolii]|uniref:Uncharacterized protein n=1 Tax=Rhodococcoides trifolii TaxID=908250 RepID=A0A917CWT7_9NOCA|nr:hypothetical protein [Rhodococcus trifolii]GGF99553.1 hypothetical protein GCM10007304_11760 [Rhodococcus trifolii]
MEPHAIPSWQFAFDDLCTWYVVITDPHADLTGWSIHYNHIDGTADSSPFVQNDADFRYIELATRTAWTATIEAAALLDGFETAGGQILPVEPWDGLAAWLVESMTDSRPGMIIDLGPNTDIPDEEIEDFELVNAQIHVLEDGVFLVRRSRRILRQLRFVDHSVAGLDLDLWHHDGLFDDCTDGYLFSRDRHLVASACAAWLRDNGGEDALDQLGCSFEFADELPRTT